MHLITAIAPTNIAVVKYWGKRDAKLNLPINSSLSVTLDMSDLRTVTSVAVSEQFESDRVWLNGNEVDVIGNSRLTTVFAQIRARSTMTSKSWKVHVVSKNSFPTAAGLASSASGYACLTKALAELFRIDGDVSDIARMGSGSACRSLLGGYVRWSMGVRDDGADSVASQVLLQQNWDSVHALICVVSGDEKTTSSTGGMIDSSLTSEFLKYRAKEIVPKRMYDMEAAIQSQNFSRFGELTMKDSNSFHATCLDTFPPIKYLNDTSFEIMNLVHALNRDAGAIIAAYTFDAGPNAVIFMEQQNVDKVLLRLISSDIFGSFEIRGRTIRAADTMREKDSPIKYIIHTKVGSGAQISPVESDLCLVDNITGLPK